MYIAGNGILITQDKENPIIHNGAVAWDGKLIIDIGDTEQLKKQYPKADFIDARGCVIMPGLINMHHHIYSTFARGISMPNYNPLNFMDVLNGLWWTLDRKLTLDDTLHSARVVYADCIKNGVTTVFDHHASFGAIEGSLDQISISAKEAGVRTCLCYEVSDRDGKEKSRQSVQENERFIKQCAENNTDDMQQAMMGLHASFTVETETLERCVDIAKKYGTGCHIHTAEGIDDVHDAEAKYGKRVIERLYDKGVLFDKTIAVHCVHINDHEMDLLKQTDTMVVHNPESNMGNAVGCPNVLKQFAKGIMIGLGTDGFTSDVTESYKVGNVLHKHLAGSPNVAWTEIPTMLFEHNRKMANRYFKTPLGILQKGAAADIIVTDYKPFTPMTKDNFTGHILFGMNGRNTLTTIIAGKILMKDRKFTILDEDKIIADALVQANKLWKSL